MGPELKISSGIIRQFGDSTLAGKIHRLPSTPILARWLFPQWNDSVQFRRHYSLQHEPKPAKGQLQFR